MVTSSVIISLGWVGSQRRDDPTTGVDTKSLPNPTVHLSSPCLSSTQADVERRKVMVEAKDCGLEAATEAFGINDSQDTGRCYVIALFPDLAHTLLAVRALRKRPGLIHHVIHTAGRILHQ